MAQSKEKEDTCSLLYNKACLLHSVVVVNVTRTPETFKMLFYATIRYARCAVLFEGALKIVKQVTKSMVVSYSSLHNCINLDYVKLSLKKFVLDNIIHYLYLKSI